MSQAPTEYLALAAMTIFFLFAWFPTSVGKAQAYGLSWLASNRDQLPPKELPLWAQRCDRAYANLRDNFPAFAVSVLVLGAMAKFDSSTSVAAMGFVVGRLFHFGAYGLGNFLVRFLSYLLALVCNSLLLIKIFL